MIYLMISLTFFTANALAILSYTATGNNNVAGMIAKTDSLSISTLSDGNVSIMTNNEDAIPMDCDSSKPEKCNWQFEEETMSDDVNNITFVLQQDSGYPLTREGIVYVDSVGPTINYFNYIKKANSLIINYSVTDSLYSGSSGCSGIDTLNFYVNNDVYPMVYKTKPGACTVSGSYIINFTGSQDLTISMDATDNAGNPPTTSNQLNPNGDFEPPNILDNFELMSGSDELDTFSSSTDRLVDVVVHIDDQNLDTSSVIGNLAKLNTNPAINTPYKNIKASCNPDGSNNNSYNCIFSGIKLRPVSETLNITVFAKDKYDLSTTKELDKDITIVNNAGQVLYLGPDKNKCTPDLKNCYITQGPNVFYTEFDTTSSYNLSRITLGIGSDKTFAFCSQLDTEWQCLSYYNVMQASGPIKLSIVSPSFDDYGNSVFGKDKTLIIDNDYPTIISDITNTSTCPVAGESLRLSFRAREATSPILKLYVNTSQFTSKDTQAGTCTPDTNDEWDCSIDIDSFVTSHTIVPENIVLEDLAGNQKLIPYKFEVCEANQDSTPNAITKITQTSIPRIDRRTASLLPIKTYVPLDITTIGYQASIMSLTVDQCTAEGIDGSDVMDVGHYFLSAGNNPMMVLYIGHSGAQVPLDSMDINCTISAKVRIANKVFTKPEIENFKVNVNTFNNVLGTVDDSVLTKINNEKMHLRELSSNIDYYKGWDNILGSLCTIAQVMSKINSLLQALKAVVYAIAIGLQVAFGVGNAIWAPTNTALSAVDKFVGEFFWPVGITAYSHPIGIIVKYSCEIYTCQFMKVSGLYSMTLDTIAIANGPATRANDQANAVSAANKEADDTRSMSSKDVSEKEAAEVKAAAQPYIDEAAKEGRIVTTESPDVADIVAPITAKYAQAATINAALAKTVDATNTAQVQAIKDSIKSNQDALATLKKNKDDLQKTLKELTAKGDARTSEENTQLATVKTQLTTLESQIATQTNMIATLNARLAVKQDAAATSAATTSLPATQQNLHALKTSIDGNQGLINQLVAMKATLSQQQTEATTNLNTLKNSGADQSDSAQYSSYFAAQQLLDNINAQIISNDKNIQDTQKILNSESQQYAALSSAVQSQSSLYNPLTGPKYAIIPSESTTKAQTSIGMTYVGDLYGNIEADGSFVPTPRGQGTNVNLYKDLDDNYHLFQVVNGQEVNEEVPVNFNPAQLADENTFVAGTASTGTGGTPGTGTGKGTTANTPTGPTAQPFANGNTIYSFDSAKNLYVSADGKYAYDQTKDIFYVQKDGSWQIDSSRLTSNAEVSMLATSPFQDKKIIGSIGMISDVSINGVSYIANPKYNGNTLSPLSISSHDTIYQSSATGAYYISQDMGSGYSDLVPITADKIMVGSEQSTTLAQAQNYAATQTKLQKGLQIATTVMQVGLLTSRITSVAPLVEQGAKLLTSGGGNLLATESVQYGARLLPEVSSSTASMSELTLSNGVKILVPKVIEPVSQDLSGNAVISNSVDTAATGAPAEQAQVRNTEFFNELQSQDWIVNPYKSVHYDGLCMPAILYNLEKEKQIRCIYLSCMEKQYAAGLPETVCEKEYGMNSCLYLDSAQWKLAENDWSVIFSGFLKSAMVAAIGMIPQVVYSAVCDAPPVPAEGVASVNWKCGVGSPDSINVGTGWPCVGCGLASVLLRSKELISIFESGGFSNLISSGRPDDPAKQHDYCAGVDYSG